MIQNTVRVIGVPLDLGAGRRGVDMGPSAIRAAKLHDRIRALGYKVEDGGNVFSPEPEERTPKDPKVKYLDEVLAACKDLADRVDRAVKDGVTPIVLGGDHSVAIGTQAGLARNSKRRGLIWFDAHADFNTHETSPSGNIHGMPVSAILGLGHDRLANFDRPGPKLDPRNVVLLGLRSVDKQEAELLTDSRVTYYTMRDIDETGMRNVVEEALQRAGKGVDQVHLSFDLDVVDPRWAPGTGTTVEGGLTYREAHLGMEILADSGLLSSLEFVEVNPLLDNGNTTGNFTVGLIASALGKSIVQPDAAKPGGRKGKRGPF
ncbi:MAG TPA: arginase [Candidatus Thermoplasmatota archaeon]|nr:arginase [Candidatus Thermoplasmatota archaeon]